MGRNSADSSIAFASPSTSLFACARLEAERHKWLESEKAGRDLGEQAIQEWSRRHWWIWCRERWIEHLSGERLWEELDRADFGLLQRGFHPNGALIRGIVQRIKEGGENLDIIQWVIVSGACLEDAVAILRRLDINARRLRFWP